MAKSADYLISGVWKDSEERITHVMLHSMTNENSWKMGEKTSELEAINLLKQHKNIKTVVWEYPNWDIKVEKPVKLTTLFQCKLTTSFGAN